MNVHDTTPFCYAKHVANSRCLSFSPQGRTAPGHSDSRDIFFYGLAISLGGLGGTGRHWCRSPFVLYIPFIAVMEPQSRSGACLR